MKNGWADIKRKYKIYSTKKYNQIKRLNANCFFGKKF